VYQVFVVKELVALRTHETAVEPEQTTEARSFPDFVVLETRFARLQQASSLEEISGVLAQPLG